MPSWFDRAFYAVCSWICQAGLTFGSSFRAKGKHHIPRTGPVLIIANHQSMLDPVLIGLAAPRMLTYLARKTLFHQPLFAWLIRMLHAVPVDQDGVAKEGMRAVLQALEAGRAVLIFPEGGRTENGKIAPLMRGIALLIERSKAPVVPVGIAGAFQALPRGRVFPRLSPLFLPAEKSAIAVSIGRLISPQELSKLSRQELLERLGAELEMVFAEAERLRRKPEPIHCNGWA
jgi:1-acyl-sn-glycerol-3-phosphate acyltransferase